MAFLPMFPLKLVVFPGESLNLHIFEPRYRVLVDDCLLFGIPMVDASGKGEMASIGTEVELVDFAKKYPGGESDIKTVGKRRFKIEQFYRKASGKPYAGAEVTFLEDIDDADFILSEQIIDKIGELFQMLNIQKEFEQNANDFRCFTVGHHVGFSAEQELELLGIERESERQQFMLNHLEHFIPHIKEMHRLKERIKMNGHFKDLRNPEDW